jgi:hypothetical protein
MAVDEHMVPLKCHSSMKQYMSMKPVRHGCKVWCLAYLSTEFVSSLVYIQGKKMYFFLKRSLLLWQFIQNKQRYIQLFLTPIDYCGSHSSHEVVIRTIRRNDGKGSENIRHCMQGGIKVIHPTLHTSHPNGVTSTKCCIDKVISPDYGHTVVWNL